MTVKKTMKKLFSHFFSGIRGLVIAAAIGVSIAAFVYLAFLQRHFFSYRYIAYTIAIAAASTLAVGWCNQHYIYQRLRFLAKKIRGFTIAIAIFLSIILLINIKIEPFYAILPDTSLEITFNTPPLPDDQEGVRLLLIETGQGFVPYSYLEYHGEWERIFGNTIFSPNQEVAVNWTGKVGTQAIIAFRKTNFSQPLTVTWNGTSQTQNLQGDNKEDLFFRTNFDIPWYYFLPFIVSFFVTAFYLTLTALIWMAGWNIPQNASAAQHKPSTWLVFALPMLAVWLLVLLILWPGILTNDSLSIWSMAQTGQIDDWQSAFYTFLIAVLSGIVPSPAFVLILQIIIFALVVAWGLSILRTNGVPPFVLWSASLLMAFFPPTILYVVTLWKDIPYAIAMLALTIGLFAIVASDGKWGTQHGRWVMIAIFAFLVGIFRHNGAPVAAIVVLMLPFAFRKFWKPYASAAALSIFLILLVRGPIYDQWIVAQERSGQSNLIFLHHIAAHIDAGTNLTTDEEQYLNQFQPVNDWNYSCCYVGNISYDQDFNRSGFLSNTPSNRKLAIDLFKRAPLVDIRHAFCAGELSYQFMNNQQCWHMKSLHGFINTHPGKENWIGNVHNTGISEASLLPGLISPLILALRPFGIFDASLVFYLRPAFWLFISMMASSVLVIRRQNPNYLVALLPTLGQSLLLFLIAFASAFRYYYSNCLIGIFLLASIFLPQKDHTSPNNIK